jgi:PAS domain S-box-containing protein
MEGGICVSDPCTDEILFISDKLAEWCKVEGDPLGRSCWDALARRNRRCGGCPKHRLEEKPEETVIREGNLPGASGRYRLTDSLIVWDDGGKAHLRQVADISREKDIQSALQKMRDQQGLMTAMLQDFVSDTGLAPFISKALKMAGNFMRVSGITLLRINDSGDGLGYFSGWRSREQELPGPEELTFPLEESTPLYDAFLLKKLPYVAYDHLENGIFPFLEALGVKSLLSLPIHVYDMFWGVLNFDERLAGHTWNSDDLRFAGFIAGIVSGAMVRKQAEERLLRLYEIIDSAPQFISFFSPGGKLEYVNPGGEAITGYTAMELCLKGLPLVLDERGSEYCASVLREILKKGHADFDLPIKTRQGTEKLLSVSAFTTGRDKTGISAIAVDVTEKKRLEEDLIRAKEQAEQSSRGKSEFLARMSHEMRTPLNAIAGMSNIARTADDFEKKIYCLDKIDEAAGHLLSVINDILDMSRIEAGKLELSPAVFDLEETILRARASVAFRLSEKKQTFTLELHKNLPRKIIADEQRLAQVMFNLLSNAVKFTPEYGSISLSVRPEADRGECRLLHFEVRDSGIGVSPEQMEKLFLPFEQADGGVNRKFGGSGLGLAISANIVRMMGGDIRVESEPGKGSVFSFHIRARSAGPDAEAAPPAFIPAKAEEKPADDFRGRRILLAEDVEINREIALTLLEASGLSIDCVANGLEACAAFKSNPEGYDLILMDIQMPEMDGYEAAKQIRAMDLPRAGSIPIIAVTANAFREDIEQCLASGMNDHVGKPLELEKLLEKLRGHFGAASS